MALRGRSHGSKNPKYMHCFHSIKLLIKTNQTEEQLNQCYSVKHGDTRGGKIMTEKETAAILDGLEGPYIKHDVTMASKFLSFCQWEKLMMKNTTSIFECPLHCPYWSSAYCIWGRAQLTLQMDAGYTRQPSSAQIFVVNSKYISGLRGTWTSEQIVLTVDF